MRFFASITWSGYSSVGRASDCRALQLSDVPWFPGGRILAELSQEELWNRVCLLVFEQLPEAVLGATMGSFPSG